MDIKNIVVFNTLTGDLVPYLIKDNQIVLNGSSDIDENNCIVTVWSNLPELNKKYGFMKEKNAKKII